MSHFTVAVLVPQDKVPEPGHPDFASQVITAACEMLEPFNEDIEVEPYQRPCNCAEYAVSRESRKLTEQETGFTVEIMRAAWWAKTDEEREQLEWEDFIKPYTSVLERYREDLSQSAKPEADCSDCHGTGFYGSTYNKLSKWDWYSVGGRWDGRYEEEKIPTIIPNVAFARDLHSAAYAPFALLTPREPHQKQAYDNWSEKGEMGWFAMVANENDNWPAIVSELLDKYSACFAVLMDCHI